jgi:hypothetical protein
VFFSKEGPYSLFQTIESDYSGFFFFAEPVPSIYFYNLIIFFLQWMIWRFQFQNAKLVRQAGRLNEGRYYERKG